MRLQRLFFLISGGAFQRSPFYRFEPFSALQISRSSAFMSEALISRFAKLHLGMARVVMCWLCMIQQSWSYPSNFHRVAVEPEPEEETKSKVLSSKSPDARDVALKELQRRRSLYLMSPAALFPSPATQRSSFTPAKAFSFEAFGESGYGRPVVRLVFTCEISPCVVCLSQWSIAACNPAQLGLDQSSNICGRISKRGAQSSSNWDGLGAPC